MVMVNGLIDVLCVENIRPVIISIQIIPNLHSISHITVKIVERMLKTDHQFFLIGKLNRGIQLLKDWGII